MDYASVPYSAHIAETLAALNDPGVLLVSAGRDGYLNAMIIGWGTIGTIWGKPIFTVLVRPSRFTFGLIEETGTFTVCVPADDMGDVVGFCGNKSGRSHHKFDELGLVPLPSTRIGVPGIAGCKVIYECQVVHSNDILPEKLAAEVQRDFYGSGDFHRVYYGEILAVRARLEDSPAGE
jgi:flavin reductase (DIM6/NTAB) family NADH-FMN oxidoreductase RutF